MHRVATTILVFVLISYCNIASARFIQGDPVGIVPVPGVPGVPVPNMQIPPTLTTPRAITSSDVLRLHQLNQSYAYVSSSPLRYADPLGLQQTYGLPWVMPPNYIPIPQTCICPSPQGADPQVAGDIIGGTMLGFGTVNAVAQGAAAVSVAAAEATGPIAGLVVADAAASGAIAGGVVGAAVGAVVGAGIAGVYYVRSNNACNACCPR